MNKPLTPTKRPALNFPVLWQIGGWMLVALVCWLSLTPAPQHPPDFLGWDKAQHFLAYAVLMFWFAQSFPRHWRWPLLLVLLGVGLEVLQGLGGVRQYDPFDMLANGLGVLLGWALSLFPPLAPLPWLDDRLGRLLAHLGLTV